MYYNKYTEDKVKNVISSSHKTKILGEKERSINSVGYASNQSKSRKANLRCSKPGSPKRLRIEKIRL